MSNQAGKKSQYMFSHPELGSDPPNGSGRESGRDIQFELATLFSSEDPKGDALDSSCEPWVVL